MIDGQLNFKVTLVLQGGKWWARTARGRRGTLAERTGGNRSQEGRSDGGGESGL